MSMSEPNEREKILGRVREALKFAAPIPGTAHGQPAPASVSGAPSSHAREWLPHVGDGPDALLEAFRRNATDLKAEVILAGDRRGLLDAVRSLSAAGHWTSVATHTGDLTSAVAGGLDLPVLFTDRGYDASALEKCAAGITECDALVAQTGSILLTARSAGGRALSVLPPHHVVLARISQLVPDLPDAFDLLRRKYEGNYPSFISFISGPSRTGDIERILVLGAHGPKRLTILLVSEA